MATDHSISNGGASHPEAGEELNFSGVKGSGLAIVGGAAIIGAILVAAVIDHSAKRFFFAYLVNFMFFLSLALGGLFFTLLQHVTKAGWSASIRRIAEWFAASFPILAVLAVPLVLPVLIHNGTLYYWADAAAKPPAELLSPVPSHTTSGADAVARAEDKPAVQSSEVKQVENGEKGTETAEAPEEMNAFKKVYLNPVFWSVRIVFYFLVWSFIGLWYWQRSLEQDATGNVSLTTLMQARSPVALVFFAVTTTGAAFDFLMALDPTWSSTIFGIYYFAGCVIGIIGTLIVAARLLQNAGYLKKSVTIEHYHDLGKLLFGFTFFWGYIAFSQFMLQWYANLPEETLWYRHHGATSAMGSINSWTYVVVILLFGRLFIPFAGLISRHVKRNPNVLMFWAIWLLAFHWVDMFWIVTPQLDYGFHFGLVEVLLFVGIGGVFVSFALKRASAGALRPTNDPRLPAALAFQNI